METSRISLKRSADVSPMELSKRARKRAYRSIDFEEGGYLVVRGSSGVSRRFRVPNARVLDDPQGLILDAADACVKHIPLVRGFSDEFSRNYRSITASGEDDPFVRNVRLHSLTGTFNLDNPGHMLLALRGVSGDDIGAAHTAYLRALRAVLPDPAPDKILFFHAGVCKALGSAYYATPIPQTVAPTVDPIVIMYEIVVAACPDIMAYPPVSYSEERPTMLRALRRWHCPSYVRDRYAAESEKWGFDRPRERAGAITGSLKALGFDKNIII